MREPGAARRGRARGPSWGLRQRVVADAAVLAPGTPEGQDFADRCSGLCPSL